MAELFETLTGGFEEIVNVLGVPGIIIVALLENIFPLTPSEILYPLAGKASYDGDLVLWQIIAAGVVGSLIGSLIYYGVGYRLGEARTRQVIADYGQLNLMRLKINIVSVEDYDRAIGLFHRRGGIIVFVARLMPLVHGVVSIPAGVTRMRLLPFLFYTALGSALWIAPLAILGSWLGSRWEDVLYWMEVYQNVWYVVIALAVVYWVVRRYRSRQPGVKEHDYS